MSKIALEGNASGTGTFTVAAPNSSSNFTLTLPQATTTIVGTDATQTLTNKTLTSPTITGANMSSMASSVITAATSQASTSGTSIDFTGIPSWVKRITVMFSGISTNGSSNLIIQLGDSGGFETTSYLGAGSFTGSSSGASNYTTGFGFPLSNVANVSHGSVQINNINGNEWTAFGVIGLSSSAFTLNTGGSKSLSGTLTQVRITTVNGTDTFDAGSINILFE